MLNPTSVAQRHECIQYLTDCGLYYCQCFVAELYQYPTRENPALWPE